MNRLSHFYRIAPALLTAVTFLSVMEPTLAQTKEEASDSPFVRRDQINLTLSGAETVIVAARTKANELKIKENIAVVDAGGHLLAFARMDGARPASVYTAITKATSAATKLGDTGPLPSADNASTHLSLAVENAAALSGGKFTTLKGGVAIVLEGQVIGAIGVGGATGEQDEQVARSGVNALLSELKSTGGAKAEPPKNESSNTEPPNAKVPADLVGEWRVEDIQGRGVVDRSQTTIRIDEEGAAYGSTGLNRFMAQPSISEGEIAFGHFPITRRAGPPALMDQEAKFLAAIQKVKKYRVDDKRLYLLDAQDNELIRLMSMSR